MDTVLVNLKNYGCDVEGALERLLGDEELLVDCINMVLVDDGFNELKASVESGDKTAAFDAAHSLKGICGNTGLSPLFERINPVVEILRRRGDEDLSGAISDIFEIKNEIATIVNN